MTSDLREQQRHELLPARVIRRVAVALVLYFKFPEFVSRKNLEQLAKNCCDMSHGLELFVNRADTKRFVTFNIAVSLERSAFLYFLPDTTVSQLEIYQQEPDYEMVRQLRQRFASTAA